MTCLSWITHKLKILADSLGNVDHTISDESLILTMIKELNSKFSHVVMVVPPLTSFTSFLQMRSMLLLEELKAPSENSQVTALVANYASKGGSDSNGHSIGNTSYSTSNTSYRGNDNDKKCGKGKGVKGGSPCPMSYNPWTGSFTI